MSRASRYGADFDRLADTWATLEGEHDKQHPDRGECGGVGGCSLMMAGHDLEVAMIDVAREFEAYLRGEGQ